MSKNSNMKYEDIVNNMDYDDTYVPNTSGYQALSKEKTKEFIVKCVSVALIGSGIITTFIGCKKDKSKNNIASNSIVSDSDMPETLDYEFVLEKPFSNGEEKQIVDIVNSNNKNDSTVKSDLTVRMLKFFNGTLTKDDFKGMSDKEIIDEIRHYTVNVLNVLSASISDFKQMQDGEKDNYNKTVKAVAFTLFDKNSYVYKTYLVNYDGNVLNEQKSDIANKNTADYKINAEEYGKLGKKMLTDKNISVYEKTLIAIILKADYSLFSRYLSKEHREFYQKEFDSAYFTQAMNDFFNKYAIATDVLDLDCGDKTKEGESYNASDTQKAGAYAGSTGEEGKSKEVKGGQSQGSTSEVVQGSKKTGSYTSTTIVNKEKETTKTETKPGGKVVDEEVVTKPPKVIDEEDVKPGYDPINSDTYTEDEWKRRNESSSTTTTTTKQEENNSSDDREFEEILTEEEWQKYLGVGQMGLGVTLTPMVKALKKRRK